MKLPIVSAVALSLSLCSLASVPAHAQEDAPPAAPPPAAAPATSVGAPPAPGAFGSQGQLVISTDIPLHRMTEPAVAIVHESSSASGSGSETMYGIAPAADYFMAPNLSVGGSVGIVHGDASIGGAFGSGTATVTEIGISARVGYNIALTDAISLWPRLSLGYEHDSFSGGGGSVSGYTIPLVIFAPFLWHPAQHFFMGGGPIVYTELADKISGMDAGKITDIGIEATLGGYFNL